MSRFSRRSRAKRLFLVLTAISVSLFIILNFFGPSSGGRLASAEVPDASSNKPGRPPRKGAPRISEVRDAGTDAAVIVAPVVVAPPPLVPNTKDEAKTLPQGKGLPLIVNVAVSFVELGSFEEAKGEFSCTTDFRVRWTDLRLQRGTSSESKVGPGYLEFRGKEAEEQLTKMWAPSIDVANRIEAAPYSGRRLRIFGDGSVESLVRTTGRYKVKVDAERFPFDRQGLFLELIVRDDTTDEVRLGIDADDIDFSRVADGAELDGWTRSFMTLEAKAMPGWGGDEYSRVTVALAVDRIPGTSLAAIFIPLIASLLIPLLVIWMNRATDEGFEIEAFELANMGIGGLFSVIALSFAIYSSYGILAGSDNTVTRLFGLNYASLAVSLGIVVVLYQYNLVKRLFGPHVQKETFQFLTWALPLASFGTSVTFVLIAAM